MRSLLRTRKRWFPPAEFYTEELCSQCGICCGATDGHPCEHLVTREDGATACEIYEMRLGPHRTTDGHHFVCAPIRAIVETSGGYEGCAYVEEIKRIRRQMGQPTDDLGRLKVPE